jgi:DNA-binding protein HU-beta
MNTSDLIDHVAGEAGLTKVQTKAVVDGVLAQISTAAARGEEINLPGFGKFKVQDRPAREGRNPSTGETIQIAASKKIVFQPAKALKDAVNG